MKFDLLLTTAFLLLSCARTSAQQPLVESITIADGLSQGMIYDIEQTNDGFLWFATKDGLNRYDGYNFKIFVHDSFNPFSIAGNEVTGIFEDSRGNLWLNVLGKGIDVLEKTSGRFLHLPEYKSGGDISSANRFAETPDGIIWAGSDRGLLRLQWKSPDKAPAKSAQLQSYMTVDLVSRGKTADRASVISVFNNPDGTLTVAFGLDGMYRYNPRSDELAEVLPLKKDYPQIRQSPSGKIWAMSTDHLYVLEQGHVLKKVFREGIFKRIYHFCPDGQGNLIMLIGEKPPFLLYSVPEEAPIKGLITRHSSFIHKLPLSIERCPTLEVDRSNNLWIGTDGYGLRKINLTRRPFRHLLKGKSVGVIKTMKAGIFILPIEGGNYLKFNEASDTLEQDPDSPLGDTMVIPQVFQARNDRFFYRGYTVQPIQFYLGIPNNTSTEWLKVDAPHFSSRLHPFLEDSKNNIWYGCPESRLVRFRPSDKSIRYLDYSKETGPAAGAHALYEDNGEHLWVGTQNGILCYSFDALMRSGASKIISLPPSAFYQTDTADNRSLRNNLVTSFCPDPLEPARFLWVSTKGGGLNLLDKSTGKFQHFTSQNSGLPNDVVYGILPDEQGNLWMSTNRGLSRLTIVRSDKNPSTARWEYRFRNFREYDGLQSDEFNTASFARSADGRLFFGGINGITAFHPSEISERRTEAQVRLTNLKINNEVPDFFQKNSPLTRPIDQTDALLLHHNQNYVTLEFALMDFVTPQENRFRYRLQGADKDWVDAGTSHIANYTRLPSGEYLFEVQGCVAGGAWSRSATLHITVLPPWWLSRWALLLYACTLIALIAGIRQYDYRRLEAKAEARRLKDLDYAKTQLYTNITHEFRTPLTVIMGVANNISGYDQEQDLIRRNSKKLLQLINQMLDLSKIESGSMALYLVQADIIHYLRYLAESFYSMAREKDIRLTFLSEEDQVIMDFDREKLQDIMYNLLSNALKFTPQGGEITIHAALLQTGASQHLQLQVQDSGIGISESELPYIFDRFYQVNDSHTRAAGGTGIGLALTKEFVELAGGSISVAGTPGQGTTFTVLLPVKNEAPLATSGELEQITGSWPDAEPPASGSPDLHDTYGSKKPLLLLVEDNRDVVTYIQSLLQKDYAILSASDGKDGLKIALQHIPDIIISDVMMPEMDGFQLCEHLKTDERTSHIPIILLTAKAEDKDRIAGLRYGADAYLIKPFSEEELKVHLEKLTELRRRLQEYYSSHAFQSDRAVSTPPAMEDAFLKKMREIVEKHLHDPGFEATALCRAAFLSQPQLYRKLAALTGQSPSLFIRTVRLRKAAELLRTTQMSITEVAWATGFNDPNYFSRAFHKEFGKTPKSWRE